MKVEFNFHPTNKEVNLDKTYQALKKKKIIIIITRYFGTTTAYAIKPRVTIQNPALFLCNKTQISSHNCRADVSRRVSVSRHVFECLGLAMPMSRLGLGK